MAVPQFWSACNTELCVFMYLAQVATKIIASNVYCKTSLVPQAPLSIFHLQEKKKERGGLVSKVTWQTLAKWCLTTKPLISSLSVIFGLLNISLWSFWGLYYSSQYSLLFHLCQTRALENRARSRAIFTIRHSSYPGIWRYVTHMTLDPMLPLVSCVCWKDRGAWGQGYWKTDMQCFTCALEIFVAMYVIIT